MRIVVRRKDCTPKIVTLELTRTQEVVLECLVAARARPVSEQQLLGLCYSVFAADLTPAALLRDVERLGALLRDATDCDLILAVPHRGYVLSDEIRIDIPKRYWSEF